MLSLQELELLTAHVDGELTARQQRQVQHLLAQSGEARDLLARLETDSQRLRALPRLRVPEDLCGSVLAVIGREGKKPVSLRRPAQRPVVLRPWVGFAAAAAVLFAVGLA